MFEYSKYDAFLFLISISNLVKSVVSDGMPHHWLPFTVASTAGCFKAVIPLLLFLCLLLLPLL